MLDKHKLNYRFHNTDTTEAFKRELLQVCISANMQKVENAVLNNVETDNGLRTASVNKYGDATN